MNSQLAFPDMDVDKPATDRLFLAFFPEPEIAERIALLANRLRAQLGASGLPLATSRFHVTLYHVGDYVGLPQGFTERAKEAASKVAGLSFPVGFHRAVSFGRSKNRPFVLLADERDSGLREFWSKLGLELQKVGLGSCIPSAYRPHLTLFYEERELPEVEIEPIGWRAGEFRLIHSLLGQTRHIELGRWSLAS